MKQITIYDLLQLVDEKWKWAFCDSDGIWCVSKNKPIIGEEDWEFPIKTMEDLTFGSVHFFYGLPFVIKPFDGSWKDSLIKVEHSKKKNIDKKDFEDFIEQHGVSPYGFLTEAILKEDFECWKKRRKNDKDTY